MGIVEDWEAVEATFLSHWVIPGASERDAQGEEIWRPQCNPSWPITEGQTHKGAGAITCPLCKERGGNWWTNKHPNWTGPWKP